MPRGVSLSRLQPGHPSLIFGLGGRVNSNLQSSLTPSTHPQIDLLTLGPSSYRSQETVHSSITVSFVALFLALLVTGPAFTAEGSASIFFLLPNKIVDATSDGGGRMGE